MHFASGTRVIISKEKILNHGHIWPNYCADMFEYCDKPVTINHIYSRDANGLICYRIKEDHFRYVWADTWMSPVDCSTVTRQDLSQLLRFA